MEQSKGDDRSRGRGWGGGRRGVRSGCVSSFDLACPPPPSPSLLSENIFEGIGTTSVAWTRASAKEVVNILEAESTAVVC